MDLVQIHLQPYNRTFTLSKDVIAQFLPQSLFAQALEEDPNATVIDITNPVVTPEAMQTILDYTQGMEPAVANPELAAVDRYLNIPWLKYYADPLYNHIRRPVNTRVFAKWDDVTPEELGETNWTVLILALNGHSIIAEYLRQQGMDLGGALIYALSNELTEDAHDILRVMLTPYNVNERLINASIGGNIEAIKELLSQEASQASIDAVALTTAYWQEPSSLLWILNNFAFLSPPARHEVGRALVAWSQIQPHNTSNSDLATAYLGWLIAHRYV
jgi:hypothetical protein